jgi:hypothetical protein
MNKSQNRILAVTKFNDREALVLERTVELEYERFGDTIIGQDGIFHNCYVHGSMKYQKAFAGREFDLTMKDGEVVHCKGQWWYSISPILDKKLKGKIVDSTAESISKLGDCYVFGGYWANETKYRKFRRTYKGPVWEYHEFENLFIRPVKDPWIHKWCEIRDELGAVKREERTFEKLAMEYSRLRREQRRQKNVRADCIKRHGLCDGMGTHLGHDALCYENLDPDEYCDSCAWAKETDIAGIGTRCGAVLNRIHNLTKKIERENA